MKLGSLKIFTFFLLLFFFNILSVYATDKIETVPLINLEELSPTFEEEKDELEQFDESNINLNNTEGATEEIKKIKIYLLT